MTARALTHAPFRKCPRDLARGEVKRVMQRGPLVGYYVGCPACGFVASYLHDACGFLEERSAPTTVLTLVGVERPPACLKCGLRLRVEGGEVVAELAQALPNVLDPVCGVVRRPVGAAGR